MFWVYNNIFFFLNNYNFYLKNFFFLNNYNFYLFYIYKQKINFSKKNLFVNEFNINNKNNKLISNFLKYFNKVIILNKNPIKLKQLNYFYNYKNVTLYNFNNFNYYYIIKITNLIFNINKENYSFLIFDNSYKNFFPLYNYIYGMNNLLVYKKYFFIKSSFFTYNNWFSSYNNFLKKFNIIFLIIFNYSYFKKFFKTIKKLNLPIASLLPINSLEENIDYPIYVNFSLEFEKFLFLNLITQIFLISLNYKNYKKKLEYLNLFYRYSLKITKR